MLVVFGGLPSVGKSTIARIVAERTRGTYLRIDTVEQAIRSAGVLANDIGPAGYAVAADLAEENLRLGLLIIVDSVNPLAVTREMFRAAARRASKPILEVEVVCSDVREHRRRVETRAVDVADLQLPSWGDVIAREYDAWPEARLVLDTATISAADAAFEVIGALNVE